MNVRSLVKECCLSLWMISKHSNQQAYLLLFRDHKLIELLNVFQAFLDMAFVVN